jgi:hypothetical protein
MGRKYKMDKKKEIENKLKEIYEKNLKRIEESRLKNGLPPLIFGREPKHIYNKNLNKIEGVK